MHDCGSNAAWPYLYVFFSFYASVSKCRCLCVCVGGGWLHMHGSGSHYGVVGVWLKRVGGFYRWSVPPGTAGSYFPYTTAHTLSLTLLHHWLHLLPPPSLWKQLLFLIASISHLCCAACRVRVALGGLKVEVGLCCHSVDRALKNSDLDLLDMFLL